MNDDTCARFCRLDPSATCVGPLASDAWLESESQCSMSLPSLIRNMSKMTPVPEYLPCTTTRSQSANVRRRWYEKLAEVTNDPMRLLKVATPLLAIGLCCRYGSAQYWS